MNKSAGKFLAIFFIFFAVHVSGQDVNSNSPKPSSSSGQQKKAEKKKQKQQKDLAKAIEKGKERHIKLQTKNTKNMMRKSKRKSKQWNDNRK